MGHNNNYAGMHWIYFNHYGKYEDLSYYDRLAAKKREKQTIINTMIPGKKGEDLPMSKKEKIDPVDKSNKERKGLGTNNEANQRKTDDKKDIVIADRHFAASFDVVDNIFTIAFEKRINLCPILRTSEIMCQDDIRFSNQQRWKMFDAEKTFVFLSLLADQMGCEVYEFFALGAEGRKNKIRRALENIIRESKIEEGDNIEIRAWFSCSEYTDEVDDKEFIVTEISISDYFYRNETHTGDDWLYNRMEYSLNRYCDKETGEILEYDLQVCVSPSSNSGIGRFESHFMYTGSTIWKEKSGFLADTFENIYKKYKVAEESGFKI